jgi:hypothetical protein
MTIIGSLYDITQSFVWLVWCHTKFCMIGMMSYKKLYHVILVTVWFVWSVFIDVGPANVYNGFELWCGQGSDCNTDSEIKLYRRTQWRWQRVNLNGKQYQLESWLSLWKHTCIIKLRQTWYMVVGCIFLKARRQAMNAPYILWDHRIKLLLVLEIRSHNAINVSWMMIPH